MNPYKIYDTEPSSWKELQQFTANILSECGYETEIQKSIDTVRGKVEVDVYGERKEAFESKVICECKYWEPPVPQTVIHAFRTVINDSGIGQGYIISKTGFQKGAYEAITKSNVSILSWDKFQNKFKLEWLTQVIERNYKVGRELMKVSTDIISMIHRGELSLNEKEMGDFYAQKESDFNFFTFKEHYLDLENYEISYPQIDNSIKSFERKKAVNFTSYREFFNTVHDECNKIIAEWSRILSDSKSF